MSEEKASRVLDGRRMVEDVHDAIDAITRVTAAREILKNCPESLSETSRGRVAQADLALGRALLDLMRDLEDKMGLS